MHKDITTMRSVTKFLLLLCLPVVGQAAMAQSAGTDTYVYTDPQGTPLAEADANGNITATFDYTPYGSTALGTPPNGPGYTGHVNDPETNLVYMQARYYDAATGHFLSVDPMSPEKGNTFRFNRYVYGNDNPIRNTDPTGKYSCSGGDNCADFEVGLARIALAAANLPARSVGRQDLAQILSFYGTPGDGNNVHVVFGKIETTAIANTSASKAGALTNGSATITIDMNKVLSAKSRSDGSTKGAEFAATIAHEGRHGVNGMNKNIPETTSSALEYADEQSAYTSQGYVNMGLGVNSAYGIWQQGDSNLNQGKIDQSAEASTRIWCSSSKASGC
jgi:RHS repeat-associated protein